MHKSTTTSRTIGDRGFAAISAVEGLRLNSESQTRLQKLKNSKLTAEQRRSEVLRAYKRSGAS